MTANKPSDAIPEVMKRRIKELERDGYNKDFLRCFRNAIRSLDETDRYAHANKVQAEEIKALAARLAEAEREADLYHKAMEALRSTKMKHGLCQPRERMACTHCNAVDKLDAMLIAYKGRRIVASFAGAAVSASGVQK